jgi:DNA polymerase-4
MIEQPLTIRGFPRAILHIDGDAFFASCEQSRDIKLRGKPVITGKERGIAASMSYEAKAMGVTRGMALWQIRKVCPQAIILPSDYETYSLLSKRFYTIVRRWTPDVEEYGIDECFADLTGLRRSFGMSYEEMAVKLKEELDRELGFTFSVGLAPTKVVAKVGSKWMKPSGLTVIPGYDIHRYLAKLPTEKIWGIGPQTSEFLKKQGILTALQFARKSEEWIHAHLTKPHFEIWQELQGKSVMPMVLDEKTTYYSVQKVKTFSPSSHEKAFIFAQLSKNIENACIKLRRYHLAAGEATFFLKLQDFKYSGINVRFNHLTCVPSEIVKIAAEHFVEFFDPRYEYRSTGVVLSRLGSNEIKQMDLFGQLLETERATKLYSVIDTINAKFGKHAVYLASSHKAKETAQHEGDRGDIPKRKSDLFLGETPRKRIGIPMFTGEIK